MPTKRKRSVSKVAVAAAAAATPAEENHDEEITPYRKSSMSLFFEHMRLLSMDKTRCAETLSALIEGRCLGETTKKDDHPDCYWILLSTHVINRMMQVLETKSTNTEAKSIAILLAALCYALSTILLSDKTKLERSANAATASNSVGKFVRSVLGRAVVSITLGSTLALEQLLCSCQHVSDYSLVRKALWSALFSLDMVVHFNVVRPAVSVDGWHYALNSLLEDAATLNVDAMEEIFQSTAIVLQFSKEEEDVIRHLVELSGPHLPDKTKRGARRSSVKKSSVLADAFGLLMENVPANTIFMDGRISVRRWASMAFVWLCQGETRGLSMVVAMLENEEHWSTVLNCPAKVIEMKTPTKKKGSKGKKKGLEFATAELIRVPGTVAVATLASRFLDLICVSGANCGARVPTGGIDVYAAAISSPVETKRKVSKPPPARSDNRSISTVAIYHLIQVHAKCIQQNVKLDSFDQHESTKFCVLNDDNFGPSLPVPLNDEMQPIGDAGYYPSLHKTLDSLCRSAPTSIPNSHETVSESSKKLLAIAAAYILQSPCRHNTTRMVDVKLYNFAISQVGNSLRKLFEDEDDMAGEIDDSEVVNDDTISMVFANLKPLPVPIMLKTTKSRKKKGSDDPDECTFAGVFENTKSQDSCQILDEDLFKLYVRALINNDLFVNDEPTMRVFYSEMLELIQCCYDTRDERHQTKEDMSHDPLPISQGRHKRQKLTENKERTGQESIAYRRLNSIRAGLASDVWNVLQLCLTLQLTIRPELQRYLRESFSNDQMCIVLELGLTLDSVMATERKDARSSETCQQYQGIAFSDSGNFNLFERSLWSAHINCCVTIGRGQISFDPTSHNSSRTILGSAARQAIFTAIAKNHERSPGRWPLCLCATQHALVSSNLSSESIETKNLESSGPDRFIADSFIESIADVLMNPITVSNDVWYGRDNTVNVTWSRNEEATIAECFPLSQKDGRLLLMAVSRLPRSDQLQCVTRFVDVIFSSFVENQQMQRRQTICENPEISAFIARVITICSTMIVMVDVGPGLREALFEQVGPTMYHLPSVVSRQDALNAFCSHDQLWYKRECCFMGVFADWESPIIPDVATPVVRNELTPASRSQFTSILETAFRIGLDAATNDRGFLLFSTWNASGCRALWDKDLTAGIQVESSAIEDLVSAKFFMELREDICMLHHRIHGIGGGFSDSILSATLNNREQSSLGSTPLSDLLAGMMTKAETVLGTLIRGWETKKCEGVHSVLFFSLVEALIVYISFTVSMHTKSGDTFLKKADATTRRKPRPRRKAGDEVEILAAILSEDDISGRSEGDYDYEESHEEEKIGAFVKLHDACNAFGSAPIYPDWLDESCQYREGISNADAVEHATRALRCLNMVCKMSYALYSESLSEVLASFAKDSTDIAERTDIATRICLQSQEESNSMKVWTDAEHDDGGEFERSVAAITGFDESAIRFFLRDVECKNRRSAKEAWCPNSAQRIYGFIQDRSMHIEGLEAYQAEYRAGGEWELLLSETLLGACLKTTIIEDNTALSSDQPQAYTHAVIACATAERWRKVLESSVSHLAPVTALLRFGMGGGVGRKAHPFSEGKMTEDAHEIRVKELQPFEFGGVVVSETGKNSAFETLRLLPKISRSNRGEIRLKRACFAAASNLLIDTDTFRHLEGMNDISFVLSLLPFLTEEVDNSRFFVGDAPQARCYLLEKLIVLLQSCGMATISTEDTARSFSTIVAYLREGALLNIDTVFTASVPCNHFFEYTTERYGNGTVCSGALGGLVRILCDQRFETNFEVRSRLACILCSVAKLDYRLHISELHPKERCGPLIDQMAKAFASCGKILVQSLIRSSILKRNDNEGNTFIDDLVRHLCSLLSLLVCSSSFIESEDADVRSTASCILEVLMDGIEQQTLHSPRSGDHTALSLTFLLGTCDSKLHLIGNILFSLSRSKAGTWNTESELQILPLENFFEFVCDLSKSLSLRSQGLSGTGMQMSDFAGQDVSETVDRLATKLDSCGHGTSSKPISPAPRACSFVLRSGFHAQYWYNCYTCGLVWDKGCCTLCALTCHRGHEVAYSRHSSFFCDCGAEVASAADENRVTCKCINPLSSDDATRTFESDIAKSFLVQSKADSPATLTSSKNDCIPESEASIPAVEIASVAIPRESAIALQKLKEGAEKSKWTTLFFQLLSTLDFPAEENDRNTISNLGQGFGNDQDPDTNPRESISSKLRNRRGKVLSIDQIPSTALVPIRAARSGAFNVKLSSDTTTDRLKRAVLSKNGVSRRILASDSRGRLIVAEPCSLLFCSALPMVNATFIPDAVETLSARSQMSILGSTTVKFNIVGLKLCSENERHLLVWGVSEALVAILGARCDSVERSIDLKLGLDRNESEADFLLECKWIPGSQFAVAAVCGTAIKVYDIRQTENNRAAPSVSYSVAQDAIIKDVAFVPCQTAPAAIELLRRNMIKLYILLDSGRLHAVEMKFDANGDIDDYTSRYLESGDCISLPTGGVSSYQGIDPASPDSTSRSLGEGSSLDFLLQSRVLLYKCVSSCVLALVVDDRANVTGSFEFLPNVITSDNLGLGAEGFYMTGPYTLWTEFGIVRSEAFRVLCIAKSSRTNQPRLLSIEFNDQYTRVKQFTWSATNSMGLGLSLCSSFEGLAAFSAPVLSNEEKFKERAFASIVTSSGAMLIYGEDLEESGTSPAMTNEFKVKAPEASVTIFEKLIDISDHDNLIFGGDAVGSDPEGAKMKLSVKNSVYLLSPSREGCTLTVCISDSDESEEKKAASYNEKDTNTVEIETPTPVSMESHGRQDLVIVALRVLVGSTSQDSIPRQLLVEGRPHQLTADVKRWYDLPFTKLEILLGLRNGFVTIGITSSFSGTNPMIDAIQVYAIDRQILTSWIPTVCSQPISRICQTQNIDLPSNSDNSYLSLVQSITALKHLHHVLGSNLEKDTKEGLILKRLVRAIAINGDQRLKDAMVSLLQEVVPDEKDRQLFLDEATLSGVTKNLYLALEKFSGGLDLDDIALRVLLIQAIGGSLKASIKTAERSPRNYALSTEKLIVDKVSEISIGACGRKVLDVAILDDPKSLTLVDDVVKLVLLEIGICNSFIGVEKKIFSSFASIGELLHSSNASVVQRCCNAIAGFVESKATRHVENTVDKISEMAASQPIAYQCDSCSKFPITDSRYTLPEGDNHDIDLCINCFRVADLYAMRHCYDRSPVTLNGMTIGENAKLTCRQVSLMRPVPIANGLLIEQAVKEVKTAVAHGSSTGKEPIEEDSSLKKALSRQETMNESVDFGPILDILFNDILDLTSTALSRKCESEDMSVINVNPLLSLVLRFIKTSKDEKTHICRAKLFAIVVAKNVSVLVNDISCKTENYPRKLQLINCLRSLSQLLTGNHISEAIAPMDLSTTGKTSVPKCKDKTDPRFVCDEHQVPAVRRRCSRGVHKNRRFYVCGVERKQRCKYFRWADGDEEESEPPPPQSEFAKEMESTLWNFMEEPHGSSQVSLSTQFCYLLESELMSEGGNKDAVLPSGVKSSGSQLKSTSKTICLPSTFDRKRAVAELNDSVYCSREKLLGISGTFLMANDAHTEPAGIFLDDTDEKDLNLKVVEATLDLVSTVAGTVIDDNSREHSKTHSRWFSLLCELISLSPSEQFRSQAKRALKRLCGGRRALYHSVRDHYVFGFQFRKLLQHASGSLQASLDVQEQARQCGQRWTAEPCSWKSIDAGALLGTLDLISEDALTVANSLRIGDILDELIDVTKTRGGNWRHFCGLMSLPPRERNHKSKAQYENLTMKPDETNFTGTSPILSLLWLACSLSDRNQVKVLKLIECALTSDTKGVPSESLPDGLDMADDSIDVQSLDGTSTFEVSETFLPGKNPLAATIAHTAPEEILLSPDNGLSLDSLHAFALQFVLRGHSLEARKFSCQIATTLCKQLSPSSLGGLFLSLVSYPLTEISLLGSSSIQFLQLLEALLGLVANSIDPLDLVEVAKKLTQCFCDQMSVLRANGKGSRVYTLEFSGQGREAVKKRFDLSKCVHCNRVKPSSTKGLTNSQGPQRHNHGTLASLSRSHSSFRGPHSVGVTDGPPWLHEQVRPFIKGRLDASTDASVSDEFNLYVQLKCRLAISDVHLSITDPRGRFVKNIAIYFTPRQVNDVADLKSMEYSCRWQPCGTLSLTRGATRISYTLQVPIVAANLRFEYNDFFERPGGSRAANGSPILHCPRCTRVVNNAHGVCGHCGEVAFQCRKCRHINYDRFDSFLCVECSYCSAGTFAYEITAGVASNAVAIVDDATYNRSVKLLRVATNLYGELKSALEDKIRTADKKRQRSGIPDYMDSFGPDLKRAFLGALPTDAGSRNSTSNSGTLSPSLSRARGDNARPSSAATRARSLLRLARALRNDTDRSSHRRELLVREAFLGGSSAGHELSLEDFGDPDGDLAGFVNVEQFGSDTDPLSRLVASIHSRRENVEAVGGVNIRDISATQGSRHILPETVGASRNGKHLVEECEKLYNLMHEAERECFELSRRIYAWQRLEHDALAEITHPVQLDTKFHPSHCTKCSGPVALHFLILVMRLFSDMSKVPLTKEFVQALFLDPQNLSKDLLELKRLAITTLATKSETGAKLVLAELQGRLKVSSDGAAAEILGRLLAQGDFPLAHHFVALATQTLSDGTC